MKRLVFLIFFIFFFNGCLVDEPKVDISDIKIDGISEEKINLKLVLDVYNPNSFNVKVKYIEYNLYYDKNLFSSGYWEGEEKLLSNSNTYIPIAIFLEESHLIKIISLILKGKTQEIQNKITIEGKAVLNKFGKNFNYNFKWKYKDKKENQQEKKLEPDPIH